MVISGTQEANHQSCRDGSRLLEYRGQSNAIYRLSPAGIVNTLYEICLHEGCPGPYLLQQTGAPLKKDGNSEYTGHSKRKTTKSGV